jgi:hypothetical protein
MVNPFMEWWLMVLLTCLVWYLAQIGKHLESIARTLEYKAAEDLKSIAGSVQGISRELDPSYKGRYPGGGCG